jgi:hypothetical protein
MLKLQFALLTGITLLALAAQAQQVMVLCDRAPTPANGALQPADCKAHTTAPQCQELAPAEHEACEGYKYLYLDPDKKLTDVNGCGVDDKGSFQYFRCTN